jgi:hypothetical protein
MVKLFRSQGPRGLRHEMSSPAQTLGSWVRIPLETWMSVRLFCVDSCLATGLITRPRSYSDFKVQISELIISQCAQALRA